MTLRKITQKIAISKQMFISFSILILILMFVLTFAVTVYLSKLTNKQQELESLKVAEHISREMDSQIDNIEAAKRQFLYSSSTMNDYYEYLTKADVVKKSGAFSAVYSALYRVMGTGVPQVYLMAVYGSDKSVISAQVSNKHSYATRDELDSLGLFGGKNFKADTKVMLPETTDGGLMIRMLVSFVTTKNPNVRAILEIQQKYSVFAEIVNSATSKTGMSVLIYDADGKIIFPYGIEEKTTKLYDQTILHNSDDSHTTYITKGMSGEKELIAYSFTKAVNWTVVVTRPESIYLKPIKKLRTGIVWGCIAILLLTIGMIYFISYRLTKPLVALQNEVKNIALDTLDKIDKSVEEITYNEYEQLRRSFNEMRIKLNQSIDERMEAKREQLQTRLLALQSKMHPHFLNNVLASIQIMAEQGKQDEVVEICSELSQMLNYSMDDYEGLVPLRDEYLYALNYIKLISIRYRGRLKCKIDIPEHMMHLHVPKMIVQPLIENSIKHGMKPDGLEIYVHAEVVGNHYHIFIKDNGNGFSKEALKFYRQRGVYEFINGQKGIHESERGVGLKNISRRLELIYGEDARFSIESDSRLTVVMIGGLINRGDRNE